MKLHKYLMIFAVSAILLSSCKESASETENTATTETAAVQPETASFEIEGMSCAIGCARTIEKELAGMEGVQKATVDFEKKSAVIEFDATKQTAEKIVEAVEASAGGKTYKVSNVKSSGDQAMVFNTDPTKKDKKRKKKKTAEENKSNSPDEKSTEGKPACCAAKKACTA